MRSSGRLSSGNVPQGSDEVNDETCKDLVYLGASVVGVLFVF